MLTSSRLRGFGCKLPNQLDIVDTRHGTGTGCTPATQHWYRTTLLAPSLPQQGCPARVQHTEESQSGSDGLCWHWTGREALHPL